MKICFLLGGFYSGGIGRVVSILANRMCMNKNNTIFAVTLRPPVKEEIYKLNERVKRKYLVTQRGSVKNVIFQASYELNKYIKKNDIDYIIACGNIFYPIAILGKSYKAKVLCWEHSNVYNTKDNDGQTVLRWLGAKLSSKVITLTECDRNAYEKKFHAKRVQRIYNPIDPELKEYTGCYNLKSNKIISVGRFCYQKHFEDIPEIAKELNKITEDWTWDIFGSGDTMESVKSKIIQYGLTDKVIFRGEVKGLYKEYQNYSMIVMTSRYEGFPMTLLEGAANGLPMISYDVYTGPNEIIEQGKNGFLIKEGDTKNIALMIADLLNDSEKRKRFSMESIMTSLRFDVDKIVEEWYRLFDNLFI